MVRELVFVDDARLDSYLTQLRNTNYERGSLKASLKLPFGSGVEWSSAARGHTIPRERKIDQLLESLRDNGLLSSIRPPLQGAPSAEIQDPAFVYEIATATRVLVPLPDVEGMPRGLTVWISDPDVPETYTHPPPFNLGDEMDGGSYLYLLQEHWPHGTPEREVSGVSALQYIVNVTSG